MGDTEAKPDRFAGLLKKIFATEQHEIACDECFEHIDRYVDMLRAGQDPAVVLPQVKQHLEICHCCEVEFQALITILESEAFGSDTDQQS